MSNTAILYPVIALAALTFSVLLCIPIARLLAMQKHGLTFQSFAFGDADASPEWAVLLNKNYMNLLSLPVLFYVVAISFYVTGTVTEMIVNLSWLYVGLRLLHTIIHVTYNNVFQRFLTFTGSVTTLLVLWVLLFLAL